MSSLSTFYIIPICF